MTPGRLRCLVPLLAAGGALAAGCGTATPAGPGTGGGPESPELEAPPPVLISYDGGSSRLEPWTFCFANGCADGAPPEHPHDVGRAAEVRVSYPLDGWRFAVEFRPAGERCGRSQYAELEPDDDGTTTVRPLGYAGTYDVTLSGRGDGDLFTTFRWTTTEDGPLPVPSGRAAVLADHDGELDSYGVEVALSDLAGSPRRAEAAVKVTAEDGSSVTIRPRRLRGCQPEGTVFWSAPDDEGRTAAALPGETFTYRVAVSLDGSRHVGTATWPDDLIKGNEPSLDLEFSPPLPALTPR